MKRVVYSSLVMLVAVLGAPVFSADVSTWNAQTAGLADGINVSKEVKDSVLQSLAKYDPNQCGVVYQLSMTIRDRYLEDDTVRDTIRAHFLPRLMKRCYEFSTGMLIPDEVDLNVLSHSMAFGLVILKNIHKVPYKLWAGCNKKDFNDYAKSMCATLSHGCAITAGCSGNPMLAAGAAAFGCGAFYYSCEGDFADVVLRSFKKYYKEAGHNEELALIEHMIAKKRLLVTKEKQY